MTLYKDITFKTENFGLKKVFDVLNKTDFIVDYQIIDKFDKETTSNYTFRFYFNNTEGLTSEQITSWMNSIIEIFKEEGFVCA